MSYIGTAIVSHCDGKTRVKAKFWINANGQIEGQYKYQKMTYGVVLTRDQAISKGLIKN